MKKRAIYFLLACLLASAVGFYDRSDTKVSKEGRVTRNAAGEGEKEVELLAYIGEAENPKEVKLNVLEQSYSTEALEEYYEDMLLMLEESIKGENQSLDQVSENLNFPSKIKGYPFTLTWESEKEYLLDTNGRIGEERKEEIIKVRVHIKYQDSFYRIYEFYVKLVLPPTYISEKEFYHRLNMEEQNTREKTYLQLPEKMQNQTMRWEEKKENRGVAIFCLFLLAGFCMELAQKNEDIKIKKRRLENLIAAYPSFVTKLTLCLEAGMSLRKALEKLCFESEKGGTLQVELRYLIKELENGIAEVKAYENFGKRCQVIPYIRISNLWIQSRKKGVANFLQQMRKEVEDALEERQQRALRKGEEAGTKLLLPMGIMLVVVMLIIVVPAFLSIGI